MQQTEPNRLIRFGVFEVDARSGELRSKGSRVKLQDQPLQILLAVLEKPGQVVTREELRAKLWPADTFVDFDHGLNAAVRRLRDALGDTAENPRYIETLPRRGYRFIAATAPNTAPAERIFSPLRRRLGLLVGVASIALCTALVALEAGGLRGRLSSRADVQPPIRALAVLPLANLSGDPEQEYFSDGMTEALTDDLSKITPLRVVSRTSAMRYKATTKSPVEIARELNVDGLIAGSVLRSGNRVRISAELLDARADQHLWGQTYERDLSDVLLLQGEMAQAIAERIEVPRTPQEHSRARSTHAVSPEAYEAYLKGRFHQQVAGTRSALRQAQGYYEDAVRKDPTFALAYVGLADCYLDQGAFRLVPPQNAYREGGAAIRKALQLDASLGEAHISLGYFDWQFDWDWPAAEKELRYGIELNPSYLEGHEALVWYLAWSGRDREALAQVEKMRALDPAYPFIPIQQSGVYYHQRDYKSLVEAGEKAVATYPNGWVSHYFLAVGYDGSGRPAQAVPEYQRAVELSQADTDALAGLAHAYVASGKRLEAERILREMQEHSKAGYVSPYMIATIYASLGNKDKALAFLEKAFKEKSPDVVYFVKADLRIDPLRSDRRFQDLARRIGFPQ